MIEFAYPWIFILIIVPALVYWLTPEYKEQKSAIQVPYFKRLLAVSGKEPSKGAVVLNRRLTQHVLLVIGWLALVSAIAKPEWVGAPIEQRKSAREIMVALDLSNSMSEEDFTNNDGQKVNRLVAAKQVLNTFAEQRKHDRLGLILFADQAYLQAPFTEDISTWQSLLNQVELGYAGYQTAFGDAIGLSISVFENEQSKQRVLILLTDGADTGSKMPPIKAAKIAAKHDIKIYTIAMGDPSSKGLFAMDVDTLEQVAKATGGANFNALSNDELLKAYNTISELEQQEYETSSFRPRHSLHHWAFAIYFVANLIFAVFFMLARVSKVGAGKLNTTQATVEEKQGESHG